MFAPIVLFGFNRPYHTKLSLESLSNNKESNESDLFVFIDGPKSNSQSHLINNVETVVNSYKNSFKSIVIYKSETNLGSASNLRNGITKIFKTYNNAIFIEDDIVQLDYKVNKLPKEILKEAKRLLPNSNYVGFSITQGNEY